MAITRKDIAQVQWITDNGIEFFSPQNNYIIALMNNRWVLNEDLEFLSLADAIDYVRALNV